jgi:hypothetical protein
VSDATPKNDETVAERFVRALRMEVHKDRRLYEALVRHSQGIANALDKWLEERKQPN